MGAEILQGDVIERLAGLGAESVTACLCDPPYGLEFMGKGWDHGVPGIPYWEAVWRVLAPGGVLMAFGGTRTVHRLTCAIEDAGFEIVDRLMWVYGCLSADTEILTPDGWARHDSLTCGSTVMGYNVNSDSLEWHEIQEVYTYAYSDTAYHIVSDSTDQIVSRSHRCLVERGGAYAFEVAERLGDQERVPVLENVPSVRRDILASSVVGKEGQSADLFTALQRDIAGPRVGQARTQGARWLDGQEPRQLSGEDERRKQSSLEGRSDILPQAWQLCPDQVREVSRGVPGDGAQRRLYHGASADCGARVGAVSQAIRGSASQESRSDGQSARESDTVCQQYGAQEIRGAWRTRPTLATVEPIYYNGIVWCVSVPTGAFVARRNGHVFVTGNSGFPKSHSIGKAIDKAAGAEREVVGQYQGARNGNGRNIDYGAFASADDGKVNITAPATPAAATWDGWGTALKPSFEPIVCAVKPLTDVPNHAKLVEINHLLGGMIWALLSSVNDAESVLRSSPVGQDEASVFVAVLAALLDGTASGELQGRMDTFNSRETVSTCLSIASLWSDILAGSWNPGSTFTTRTATALTTALQTLSCLLSTSMPADLVRAVSQADGGESDARTAESGLTSDSTKSRQPSITTAQEPVSWEQNASGIDAKNAAASLQPIIPSVASVLSLAHRQLTIARDEPIKPNAEPIILARKPRRGTYAATALEHGAGALWIDGGRVGANGGTTRSEQAPYAASGWRTGHKVVTLHAGRWPANLITDGSAEATAGMPETKSGVAVQRNRDGKVHNQIYGAYAKPPGDDVGYHDTDTSAARFFACCEQDERCALCGLPLDTRWGISWNPDRANGAGQSSLPNEANRDFVQASVRQPGLLIGAGESEFSPTTPAPNAETNSEAMQARDADFAPKPARGKPTEASAIEFAPRRYAYHPKASRRERDAGLEGWEVRPAHTMSGGECIADGRTAAKGKAQGRCVHPCVKPLALTRYLATLLRPPEAYLDEATLLVPFAGVASEMIGAVLAGWRNVIGVELDPEYCEMGEARLAWWQRAMAETQETEPKAILAAMPKRKSGLTSAQEEQRAFVRAWQAALGL